MKRRITIIAASVFMALLSIVDLGASHPNPEAEWATTVDLDLWDAQTNALHLEVRKAMGMGYLSLPCHETRNASINEDGYFKVDPLAVLTNPEMPFDRYTVDIVGPLTDTFFCEHVGEQFEVQVMDNMTGNTCWTLYTVEDKLPPVLVCTPDTLVCNIDLDSIDFEDYLEEASDNCSTGYPDLNSSYDVQEFGCHPIFAGLVRVTWTATDASGNTSICDQELYLEKPPIDSVEFPEDIILTCPDADTDVSVTGVPTIFGRPFDEFCDFYTFISDQTGPGCGDEQKIIRTFMVMDLCSNFMKTGVQEIFIQDTIAPTLTCPSEVPVSPDPHDCGGIVTIPDVEVTDACSDDNSITIKVRILEIFGTFNPGDEVELEPGDYTLRYIAEDVCNNADTCFVSFSVTDLSEPNVVCDDISVQLINDNGTVTLDTSSFNSFASDDCGDVTARIRRLETFCDGEASDLNFGTELTFCCEDVGQVVMVEVEFSDDEGNVLPCMVEVEVQDKVAPTAECQDFTVSLNSDGEATLLAENIDDGSTDNCGIEFRTISRSNFDCDDAGQTFPVDLIVTDFGGLSDTCQANVTVQEMSAVNLDCNDFEIDLGPDGQATITVDDVASTTMSGCNLDVSLAVTPNQFDCGNIGDNPVTVTLTVNGVVQETCMPTVTVTSSVEPEAECKDFTLMLDENGNGIVTAQDIDNGSGVSCGVAGITVSPNQFDCEDAGTTRAVILTVTDGLGGADECEATVTIVDPFEVGISCPADITVSAGQGTGDCDNAMVTLPPAQLTTSNPTASITNNFNNGGANASGIYPVGTTTVTFTAMDNCGDPVTCTTTVTVEPGEELTYSCQKQIFTMESNTFIFDADDNFVVFDNGDCGGSSDGFMFSFTLDPDLSEPFVITCDSLSFAGEWSGLFEVFIFLPDGTIDSCDVGARVVDTEGFCDDQLGTISGEVEFLSTTSTDETSVTAQSQSQVQEVMLGADEEYTIYGLPTGQSYQVVPYNNDNHMQGVSALDMVAIRRHLLGISQLASPYHHIAADVNSSNSVSTADILEIQRLLLGITSEFPNSSAWKFVDAEHEFSEGSNPLLGGYPDAVFIDTLGHSVSDVNFVSVKTGDVNFELDGLYDPELNWRNEGVHSFYYPSMSWEENEIIEIPVYGSIEDLEALQLGLGFHSGKLDLLEVRSETLAGFSDANVSYLQEDKGHVRILWLANQLSDVEEGQALFVMKFRTKKAGSTQGVLRLSNMDFGSRVYHGDNTIADIELRVAQEEENYELMQNVPNPFENETSIPYALPEDAEVKLTFYTIHGQLLHEKKQKGNSGANKYTWRTKNVDYQGVVIYSIESKYGKISRKMTLLR